MSLTTDELASSRTLRAKRSTPGPSRAARAGVAEPRLPGPDGFRSTSSTKARFIGNIGSMRGSAGGQQRAVDGRRAEQPADDPPGPGFEQRHLGRRDDRRPGPCFPAAALSGPLTALLTLGGIAVAAAALTLTLPPDDRAPRRTGDHEQIPEKSRDESREGGRGDALKDSHDGGRGESHEGGREESGDSGVERTEVWKTFRRFVACSRREDGRRDSPRGRA